MQVGRPVVQLASSGPLGITAGPSGTIWFDEHDGENIGRITIADCASPLTCPIDEYPVYGNGPTSVAVGADQNIWYAETASGSLARLFLRGL